MTNTTHTKADTARRFSVKTKGMLPIRSVKTLPSMANLKGEIITTPFVACLHLSTHLVKMRSEVQTGNAGGVAISQPVKVKRLAPIIGKT
jgi:hypothetical protein